MTKKLKQKQKMVLPKTLKAVELTAQDLEAIVGGGGEDGPRNSTDPGIDLNHNETMVNRVKDN